MAIYTTYKLEQDILNEKVEYIANLISDIKNRELKFIDTHHINKTNLNFNQSIIALKDYYPKTYNYLISKNLKFQLLLY